MKSRSESLIRLKKFQVDEKRRQVTQIEMMIADFERMAAELDQQIEIEQHQDRHLGCRALRLFDLRQGGDRAARQPAAPRPPTCATSSKRRRMRWPKRSRI